ncbi:MAG: hypothetical protein ACO27F_06540, partial [Beijerinckiaceae bacterium]
ISEAAATPSVIGLTEGQGRLSPKGALDVEGVKTVLQLREQYGEPQKKMGAPEKYYDLTYYNKALGK